MACCPFHDDKHPSMKVDRRFHCFGCQGDGDVIDFTARLFGLNKKEAALKLAEDFSVSFDAKGMTRPAGGRSNGKSARNCATGRRSRNVSGCCVITCICWNAGRRNMPRRRRRKHGTPLFVEALQKKPYTEYLLDILLSGSMEERACVVAEYGKEVRKIEQRISEFTASHPAGRHERSRSLSAGAER